MRKIGIVMGGLAIIGLPALVWAGTIDTTAHNFTAAGNDWNTNGYKCQICHTPHEAGATKLIWNHTLSSANFTWDETKTSGGTTLPSNIQTWAGTTRNCLSCHDGTVAIGDLYHDGYTTSPKVTGEFVIASGQNMSKNHPVAIPYPYLQAKNTYNANQTGSAVSLTTFIQDPTTSGIRLYSDDGTGKVSVGPTATKSGMECGSCHNPHDGTNSPLLRVSNTNNQICEACHTY